MDRYVFYHRHGTDAKDVTAAKKTARALGARVVRAVAGSLLVEAEPGQIEQVAQALPGWCYSPDARLHRIPERTPLQRVRLAASKSN